MIKTELRKAYASPSAQVFRAKCRFLLEEGSITDGSLQADGEDMPAQL